MIPRRITTAKTQAIEAMRIAVWPADIVPVA
jgi:hypothetical protein